MIAGELDLSIGGIACLTGIISSLMLDKGFGLFISIICGLIVGIVFGFLNGWLTTAFKIPSMVVTLATMNMANGIANLITGGTAIYDLPKSFSYLGRGYIGFFPVQVVFMLVIVVLSHVVISKTIPGRYAYAIGGNNVVATLAGIKTNRYKIKYFIFCGITASMVGLIMTSRLGSGQPNLAATLNMDTITAVVIGGP